MDQRTLVSVVNFFNEQRTTDMPSVLAGVIHNRGVGRFGIVVGVEEQRMLSPPPRAAIVQAPEGDAFDDIFVLLEDCEEPRVVFGLRVEVFGGRRRCTLAEPRRPKPSPNWPPDAPRIVTSSSVMLTFSPSDA